jgi:hypothetical protein
MLELGVALLQTYSWIEISPLGAFRDMGKHHSQFKWFRKLWVVLSRYEYINTYQRAIIKIKDQEN